jgi:hypothetical protein
MNSSLTKKVEEVITEEVMTDQGVLTLVSTDSRVVTIPLEYQEIDVNSVD